MTTPGVLGGLELLAFARGERSTNYRFALTETEAMFGPAEAPLSAMFGPAEAPLSAKLAAGETLLAPDEALFLS